ncbi:hypothetical protein Acid345_4756 [Candidatus Koribacter versatilis Ellin345]|uniref:DUF2393 domain-containing protein n=1 Tax=Koribacter versatilis (strain Ellin345) TaxID=204669 RepID=Q1IH95_KORVE|nr:hypothetical protein [Candidatus Koribacter versatilis]ABF43755.1 hypothetical protein Acid345_4756 [Candidatus Koribacter versatilis Ellin345]
MATNPRIPEHPEERRGPRLVPKAEPPTSAFPGVVLAIITALLLLAAVMYFMPRAPKSGEAISSTAAQPGPEDIQLSGLHMTEAPNGGALNFDGNVVNNGNEVINGLMAAVTFTLADGRTAVVNAPVMLVDIKAGAKNTDATTGDTKSPVNEPLKAGEQRTARITVDAVPQGWNHQMPEVRVVTTTGTTK